MQWHVAVVSLSHRTLLSSSALPSFPSSVSLLPLAFSLSTSPPNFQHQVEATARQLLAESTFILIETRTSEWRGASMQAQRLDLPDLGDLSRMLQAVSQQLAACHSEPGAASGGAAAGPAASTILCAHFDVVAPAVSAVVQPAQQSLRTLSQLARAGYSPVELAAKETLRNLSLFLLPEGTDGGVGAAESAAAAAAPQAASAAVATPAGPAASSTLSAADARTMGNAPADASTTALSACQIAFLGMLRGLEARGANTGLVT